MSGPQELHIRCPQELHISFQHIDTDKHLKTDYDILLIKGEKSAHTVEINGFSYAVLGKEERLDTACEILKSVSLDSILNSEDLKRGLSVRKDILFPVTQKADDIGPTTLGVKSPLSVSTTLVPENANHQRIERVNKYIDALKKSDFYSGVVLVAEGGKIVRQEVIRPEKLEQKGFTAETPFNILSVGKLFTTVAIMQLVENKDISLDQPIHELLKLEDYTLEGCDETYERGKLNKGDLEAFMGDKNITIRHLLTHTAGLVEKHGSLSSYDATKVGKKSIYSNLGFQLLARIVAGKTGMPFTDYVREHIMRASGIENEDSIKYIKDPPTQQEQPNQFCNNRPSGTLEEVEKGKHRIPSPDGNGCFWMTASDLFKFASAFSENKLLKDPLSKDILLTKNANFANRALGFQVDGDGSKEKPRMMMHPGAELGASSGLCIIEGEVPITLICLSNFSEGNLVLPGMWNAALKEDFTPPFEANEKLRTQYRSLLALGIDDAEKIQKITAEIDSQFLPVVLIELEENRRLDLIPIIVVGISSSNIDKVALGLTEAGNVLSLKLIQLNNDYKDQPLTLKYNKYADSITIEGNGKVIDTLKPGPLNLAETVDKLCISLEKYYIFPEIGKKCSDYLREQLIRGFYNLSEPEKLCQAFTDDLLKIAGDKHMHVRLPAPDLDSSPPSTEELNGPYPLPDLIEPYVYKSTLNGGDAYLPYEIKTGFLKENPKVGFVDFRDFGNCKYMGDKPKKGQDGYDQMIDFENRRSELIAAVNHLKKAETVIIDLRNNGGGHYNCVQLLCSLFTDKGHPLSRIEWREGDSRRFDDVNTLTYEELPKDQRLLEQNVIVLISPKTFSAAEACANDLRVLQRAKIIGDFSGGGANPSNGIYRVGEFEFRIPEGVAANPIQKEKGEENWESKGITPDIIVPASDALSTAIKEIPK